MKPVAIYYGVLSYQPENLALLHENFDVIEFPDPRAETREALSRVHVLFAPLGFPVDATKMDRCPALRAIASNTTGVPHIDMDAAAARDIRVCALHDEGEFLDTITPTVEHTIGLMLATWRRLPAAHEAARNGAWERWPWGAPAMMSRLRLGIVGYGRLGRKVGEVGRSLGMTVRYYDPNAAGGVDDLMTLASNADVLSLHAVVNEDTRRLVDREILSALPHGAMVVNTARGELLDTEALLDLLEEGHIGCAALDVIDGEFDPEFAESFPSSRLARYARSNENLILTPHIGGSTVDAWRETQRRVIEKALDVVRVAK